MKRSVNDIRLSAPTLFMIVAVVGAGAFAAGRATPSASVDPHAEARAEPPPRDEVEAPLPPGHPKTTGGAPAGPMPAGHPAVDPAEPGGFDPGSSPASTLQWKAPPRWKLVPSASTMRIATYRVPRVPGDPADPELSIIRAGGTVADNADRWVGQFDAPGQKSAKRSVRTVAGLEVTVVDVAGTYSGAMTPDAPAMADWALLGAIVATPDMPHFFKLTGPARSVAAARGEFDAFVASLAPR